jgi:copper chaperone
MLGTVTYPHGVSNREVGVSVQELSYTVAGMSCAHCSVAVTEEVEQVSGVSAVEVNLDTKLVIVRGEGVSDEAVREAIREAGYEAA